MNCSFGRAPHFAAAYLAAIQRGLAPRGFGECGNRGRHTRCIPAGAAICGSLCSEHSSLTVIVPVSTLERRMTPLRLVTVATRVRYVVTAQPLPGEARAPSLRKRANAETSGDSRTPTRVAE